MGVFDETRYLLSCETCGIEETRKIKDKGQFTPNWKTSVTFENFETSWEGGYEDEPTMTKATCKTCGNTPSVKRAAE